MDKSVGFLCPMSSHMAFFLLSWPNWLLKRYPILFFHEAKKENNGFSARLTIQSFQS